MAQETVVHRVDAELVAGEAIAPIPGDLAVDGIDVPSGVEVTRDASPGDASISGPPQDVLLWLWGRAGGEALTFSGAAEPVEHLRGLLKDATQ